MNIFGELILWLMGTGFVGGIIVSSIGWVCYVLLLKMHYGEEKKNGRRYRDVRKISK